jgi:hypothetical protein
MSQGLLASIRLKCAAFSVATKEGIRIFHSLCSASSSTGTLEPLTPVLIDSDHFDRYERELLGALGKNEVLNIALTGGYGAGKSSVLKTFFDRHPEFQTAYVSLATFSKDAPSPLPISDAEPSGASARNPQPVRDSGESSTSADLIARIEETIVQQLLYAVPAARLPKTRLKRIVQTSGRSIARRTVFWGVMLIACVRLYVPTLKEIPTLDPAWLLTSLLMIPGWLAVAVTGLGGLYLMYAGLKFLSMFSIDGLTLKGGKLEAMNHGSVLHKNVDEIIYCFERSDIRVVVIEDLDRFGTQEIFFRLREINFTIRHSPQITRPVHFIYAIRDELFTVTDKTKFFDLIIPVIPVVNSENSREKLHELMKGRVADGKVLGAELDPILVETICYYIDEMRLIKNIVNEYDMFANLLSHGGLELDQNKLFAIVVFRNIYPEEFAELTKRRGKVYSLLTGLLQWAVVQANVFTQDLEKLRNEKTEREHMVLERLVDLRLRVWFEVVKASHLPGMNYVRINRDRLIDLNAFTQEETFSEICESVQWEGVSQHHNMSRGPRLTPKDVLNRVSYESRAKQLERSTEEIDDSIGAVEKSLLKLKTTSFRDAARADYGAVIAKQLPEMEALVYMLRAGYLDTDYTDYLGFFYEGSLTRDDQNLILALRRRVTLDVATPVRNPGRVIGKLEHDVLDEGHGIIAGLIAELSMSAPLTDPLNVRTQKLGVILQGGRQHLSRLADAVLMVLGGEARGALIRALHVLESDMLVELLDTDQFKGRDTRQDFICAIMDILSPKQLNQLTNRDSLLKAVSGLADVSALMPGLEASRSGWAWLRREPIRFNNLSQETGETTLRKLVEWSCLEPTYPMLSLLCTKVSGVVGDVSYLRLQSLSLTGLKSLIEGDPEAFVIGLFDQPGNLKENTESLRHLLALYAHQPVAQEDLFTHTDCEISDLAGFSENIWKLALQRDRVRSVPQAGWDYYVHMILRASEPPTEAISEEERAEIIDIFIAFLARNPIDAQRLWDNQRSETDDLQALLVASALSEDSLEQIFARTVIGPEAIIGTDIKPARWRYLASAEFVPFDPGIQEAIGNSSPIDEAAYLIKHWTTAREVVDVRKLDPQVVSFLCSDSTVPIADIGRMWEGLVERDVAEDTAVIVKLGAVCARANSENSVLPGSCRRIIESRAGDASVPWQERLELLHQALKLQVDWAATSVILALLTGGYADLLADKRSVRLPTSQQNARLAQALQDRGFVGKIKPEKDYITMYTKRAGRL